MVRCAGLGGGMGMFVAEPIVQAMAEVVETRASLAEVRRVLEIIVPLAYRPALKVGHLWQCAYRLQSNTESGA